DLITAVISRDDPDSIRKLRFDFLDLLFDAVDDVECVLAIAHDDDPANAFPTPVEFSDTAPDIAAEMDVGNIFQIDGRTVFYFEDDVLDVLNLFDVAAAADIILG